MWIIRHKDMSITQTAANSEQGAWNRLKQLNNNFARKSIRELEDLGYAARKTRTKERKRTK